MNRAVWLVWLPVLVGGCEGTTSPNHNGTCSTGQWWEGGNEESPLMHPGGDCIGCHASGEGPNYTVAGTVMNDNDPTDCYGVEGVSVLITDANGVLHELVTNAAGNYFTNASVATPYSVALELEGRSRTMLTPQTDRNCAVCHTETGANAAPGRTLAP